MLILPEHREAIASVLQAWPQEHLGSAAGLPRLAPVCREPWEIYVMQKLVRQQSCLQDLLKFMNEGATAADLFSTYSG